MRIGTLNVEGKMNAGQNNRKGEIYVAERRVSHTRGRRKEAANKDKIFCLAPVTYKFWQHELHKFVSNEDAFVRTFARSSV